MKLNVYLFNFFFYYVCVLQQISKELQHFSTLFIFSFLFEVNKLTDK